MAPDRQPDYTPEEYVDLLYTNKYIQVYLYAVILFFLLGLIIANWLDRSQSTHLRSVAQRYIASQRPR